MKILITLLILINSSFAFAADLSRWEDGDLARLISKIQTLQNYDNNKMSVLNNKWMVKCGNAVPFTCHLSEEDILPEGEARPNRVLLFRGEDGRYELAGVSSILRNALEGRGNTFCGSRCNTHSFSSNMYNTVSNLEINNANDLYYSTHTYFENGGVWTGPSAGGNSRFTALEILSAKHIKAQAMYLINENGTKVPLDPFVSTSLNPGVAIGFMDKDLRKSRLIVLSVPREKISQFHQGGPACRSNFYDRSKIIRIQSCGPLEKSAKEQEFNAFLHIPSEYVFDVISGM